MNSVPPCTTAPDTRLLPLRPGETPLALLTLLGLIAAAAIAVGAGGYEFLFYIAVVAAITIVVAYVHRRVRFSLASLWALWAWAALHMAGGMLPLPAPAGVLYNLWVIPGTLKYDQLIHAYGFGVTAWVCWQSLCTLTRPADTSPLLLAAAAFSAMGLGATNEVIEFAATKLVEKTNVGDYDNNAWDLVFNMTGAVVSVLTIRQIGRSDPESTGQPR